MTTLNDVFEPVKAGPGPNPHPLPATFSPSSLLKFLKCPLEWKNTYLPKAETPGSVATVKGNLFHSVMENIWSLPAEERTRSVAIDMVPSVWTELKGTDHTLWSLMSDPLWAPHKTELELALAHSDDRISTAAIARQNGEIVVPAKKKPVGESGLLTETAHLIANYFTLEDPSLGSSHFTPPFFEPSPAVEFEARSEFAGATFRGFVDRIEENHGGDGYSLTVTDYKTGKQKFNPKFLEDYWWQQATYGVLLEDMFGVPVNQLRLVFPSGEGGGRKYPTGRVYIRPFGAKAAQRHRLEMGYTYQKLYECWETDTWPLASPDKSRLCDWCHFKDICPKYA